MKIENLCFAKRYSGLIYKNTFSALIIISTTGKTMKTRTFVFLMRDKLVFSVYEFALFIQYLHLWIIL